MIETTVEVTGMMCGMCESHVCDALRARLPVRRVTASRRRGCAVLISDAPLSERDLRAAIQSTGYGAGAVTTRSKAPGLLSRLFHRA